MWCFAPAIIPGEWSRFDDCIRGRLRMPSGASTALMLVQLVRMRTYVNQRRSWWKLLTRISGTGYAMDVAPCDVGAVLTSSFSANDSSRLYRRALCSLLCGAQPLPVHPRPRYIFLCEVSFVCISNPVAGSKFCNALECMHCCAGYVLHA
jgi:hypothetical protein